MRWFNPFRSSRALPPSPGDWPPSAPEAALSCHTDPQPPAPPAAEPEHWRHGDLAECQLEVWWYGTSGPRPGPGRGELNVVTVLAFGCTPVGEATHGLGFARYPADVYRADAFRKIPQQADRAAAEPGFAEFLARVVPGVSIRR